MGRRVFFYRFDGALILTFSGVLFYLTAAFKRIQNWEQIFFEKMVGNLWLVLRNGPAAMEVDDGHNEYGMISWSSFLFSGLIFSFGV